MLRRISGLYAAAFQKLWAALHRRKTRRQAHNRTSEKIRSELADDHACERTRGRRSRSNGGFTGQFPPAAGGELCCSGALQIGPSMVLARLD